MLVKFTVFWKHFRRRSGWSCLWCQSVCSVYGALELDPCGVFYSVHGALGFGRFVAFYNFCGIYVGWCSALVWCLARVCFFLLNIGGCLWVWCIGAQASPSHEPLLSELGSARRSLRLGVGTHGWRARVCRPWGRNSGHPPPLSDAVVN